jgi:hypothetical protein
MQSYNIASVARALTYKSMQRVSRPRLAGDCPFCFLYVDKIKRILLQHGRAVSCHPDAQFILLGNLPNSYHPAIKFHFWLLADHGHHTRGLPQQLCLTHWTRSCIQQSKNVLAFLRNETKAVFSFS